MIPRDVLRKVKQIEIRTRHLVTDVFGGEYHSVFKGRGMEFSEVRAYTPGDDIRSIDWNVTARTGEPFIKVFQEERELTVLLLVDHSGSLSFGSRSRVKAELAAEVGALLALSAVQNNDKVGLVLFSDHVEHYVPPAKGRSHVLRVVREILFHQAKGTKTDLSSALDHLSHAQKRKAVVFVISDFIDDGYERSLAVASKRHDVTAIRLMDPADRSLPPVGLMAVEDLELGTRDWLDASDPGVQRAFRDHVAQGDQRFQEMIKKTGMDHVELWTDRDTVAPLAGFFRNRHRRQNR